VVLVEEVSLLAGELEALEDLSEEEEDLWVVVVVKMEVGAVKLEEEAITLEEVVVLSLLEGQVKEEKFIVYLSL
jgi:hypothetical protein